MLVMLAPAERLLECLIWQCMKSTHFAKLTRRMALVALDAQAPPPVRPSSARGLQHTQSW